MIVIMFFIYFCKIFVNKNIFLIILFFYMNSIIPIVLFYKMIGLIVMMISSKTRTFFISCFLLFKYPRYYLIDFCIFLYLLELELLQTFFMILIPNQRGLKKGYKIFNISLFPTSIMGWSSSNSCHSYSHQSRIWQW